tara:strand:- start:1658 stop:2083 length:426 start_codon:yes stop_codon:yes gene_type:complete
MSCETLTETIGDHEFSVTQWSAQKSILMKFKLIKTFGSAISILAGHNEDSDSGQAEALSAGLSMLFKHTSPEELLNLMTECVIGVACDGKRITPSSFNELFSGDNLLDVYKVFAFVMRTNYGNLMKGQLAENFLTKIKVNL